MKNEKHNQEQNDSVAITDADFQEFLAATGEDQWKLLLAHAEKIKKSFN